MITEIYDVLDFYGGFIPDFSSSNKEDADDYFAQFAHNGQVEEEFSITSPDYTPMSLWQQ